MKGLIRVAARSRTENMQLVVQQSGSATYDLEQVYEQNRYLPQQRSPESNVDVIKQAIIEFYAQNGIRLSESSANITYHDSCTSFSFSTAFDMHSNEGSRANQYAAQDFRETFRRSVQVGGERYRVVVWVNN